MAITRLAAAPRSPSPGIGRDANGSPSAAAKLRKARKALPPYVFITPFLVGFVIFNALPLLYAVYVSLFRQEFFGGTRFVGLANYVEVFKSGEFWQGVLRMIEFGAIQVPLTLALALFFAAVFDLALVGRAGAVYRVLYFAPYAIPIAISAIMWGYLYTPTLSPVNAMLSHVGIQFDILGPGWVMLALGNIVTWQYVGVNMVILYTMLQAIPTELTDSAAVDGASVRQLVLRIRIPLVRNGLLLTGALSVIGALQLFTEPYILNQFSTAVGSSFAPNLLVYTEAFQESNLNVAAAMSVVIGGITIIALAVLLGLGGRGRRAHARA